MPCQSAVRQAGPCTERGAVPDIKLRKVQAIAMRERRREAQEPGRQASESLLGHPCAVQDDCDGPWTTFGSLDPAEVASREQTTPAGAIGPSGPPGCFQPQPGGERPHASRRRVTQPRSPMKGPWTRSGRRERSGLMSRLAKRCR